MEHHIFKHGIITYLDYHSGQVSYGTVTTGDGQEYVFQKNELFGYITPQGESVLALITSENIRLNDEVILRERDNSRQDVAVFLNLYKLPISHINIRVQALNAITISPSFRLAA